MSESRKKKRPEFELPGVLIDAVREYLGVRTVNRLTGVQADQVMQLCSSCATQISGIIEVNEPLLLGGPDDGGFTVQYKPD